MSEPAFSRILLKLSGEVLANKHGFGIDPEKVHAQIESVSTLKSSRNNDQVTQQLNRLKMVAKSDDNVMPYIIDCVKNDCTLGEISDSFRSVFGEHNPH